MLHFIVMLFGMSFDIGGIGGLLSGMLSKSFKRALVWSSLWGIINCLVFWQLVQHGNASIVTLIPLFLAVFWSLVGWFTFGKRRKIALKPESNGIPKRQLSFGNAIGATFQAIEIVLAKIWNIHNRLFKAIGIHIYFERYPWLYVVVFFALGALLPPLGVVYALAGMAAGAERGNIRKVD